jgi:ribulose-phosphate 3-epimerase
MQIKIAPSIARTDLLNLEQEIHNLEKAKVDLIHIDITDTSYSKTIWLSPALLPAIHRITNIPLDVHILIDDPEKIFSAILPYCKKNDYVCVQLETTKDAAKLLNMIRNAGCIPALAVNVGTPENILDALVPYADMVNIIVRCIGCPAKELNKRTLDKIQNIRRLFDDNGRPEVEIEVDGSIGYDDAVLTVEKGANILVLGTKIAFRPGHTYLENCNELRDRLKILS